MVRDESRVILHVDMDAFFASVEQQRNPLRRGRPVAVCGKPPRTVVVSASYAARAFGVHAAMPLLEAQKRCPGLFCVEGKPDGLMVISDAEVPHFLDNLPKGQLRGIGPKREAALRSLGIQPGLP